MVWPFNKHREQPQTQAPERVVNNNSIPAAPLMQPAGLVELKVIEYTTDNPVLSKDLQKQMGGYSLQQTTFTDVTDEELKYILDDFDIVQMQLENATPTIDLFLDDIDKKQVDTLQFRNALYTALLKAKDGKQRNMAYSSTNIQDTRIQAGNIIASQEKKERKGFAKTVLG